jgi:hypothetical protein
MNKTAVDELIYKIHQELDWFYPKVRLSQKLVDEIKQLEKNQIMDAWNDGMCIQDTNDICAEYYYNETYKNE